MASDEPHSIPTVSNPSDAAPLSPQWPETPSQVATSPEPCWVQWLRWIGPIGPMLTTLVLCVSAVVAFHVYDEARNQNTAQRESAYLQQELLRESIDQNTMATVYAMGMEVTKYLVQYPELNVYFDSIEDYRVPAKKQDAAQRPDRLNQRFDKEPDSTKHRVWLTCEMLSDFFEYAFVLRHLLPEDDWKGWWIYFSDAYDESHFLRAFMTSRPGWYAISHVLSLPRAERDAWYLEDARRIAQVNAKKRSASPRRLTDHISTPPGE